MAFIDTAWISQVAGAEVLWRTAEAAAEVNRIAAIGTAATAAEQRLGNAAEAWAQATWPAWATFVADASQADADRQQEIASAAADHEKTAAAAHVPYVQKVTAAAVVHAISAAEAEGTYHVVMVGLQVDRAVAGAALHVAYVNEQDPATFAWIEPNGGLDYQGPASGGDDAWLDQVQTALDALGFIDQTGVSDGVNGLISLYRGNYGDAAMSAMAMIPIFGDLAKGGKYTGKALRYSDEAAGSMRFTDGPRHGLIGCFAAGTPLLTPDGAKPIEQFRPGDWVLSVPEDDPEAPLQPRRVEEVFENYMPLTTLRISGQTIRTTAEHPFWVRDRGWTAAHQLMAGDHLKSHDGRWVVLEAVSASEAAAPVYNMRVADYHTYFVGEAAWGFAVWAHNSRGCGGLGASKGGMTGDQQALKDLVDEATLGGRKPLTVDQANAVLDWADEVGYHGVRASAGDVAHPSNWTANPVPHIHIPGAGRGGHVPVMPGLKPR